jgi:hypothetical protein
MDLAQNNSYQNALKTIRVKYILGRLSDDDFSAAIFKEHKKDTKIQKKKQLLQMVDNVGTDLLQNFNVLLDKKANHISEMVKMIRGFTEMTFYFNELSCKYHSEFNSWIGLIRVIINSKEITDSFSFEAHDMIKYRY